MDLDILLYDDMVYDSENLTIPHKEMHLRDFVLTPMVQIAPWKKASDSSKKTVEELQKEVTAAWKR